MTLEKDFDHWVSRSMQQKGLKSRVMARLTSESILEEIWYGNQGLHLIGAPIRVKIDLVALGRYC
jgi:hypothetical protein